jgi:hypothetical protein
MSANGPEMRLVRDESEKKVLVEPDILYGVNGKPLINISCSAAELIPTIQYGNVSCGPIIVKRYVEDTGIDDDLKKQIRATQELCEEAIAEDRQTVHALTRQSEQGRYQS